MKISYNWLKDYVNTALTPNELDDLLTFSGLEIEGVDTMGKPKVKKTDEEPNYLQAMRAFNDMF